MTPPDAAPSESPQPDPTADSPTEGEAILTVYEVGEPTVVGFGGRDVLDHVNVAVCRDEILRLIDEHGVTTLAFDLTGVILVPSGLLGLLASLRQHNVTVHIYNPSEDVREVLAVTHLDELMPIHTVDVDRESADAG